MVGHVYRADRAMPELLRDRGAVDVSDLEDVLALQLRAAGLPEPEREVRFAPPRRWLFDFAWPDRMLACEVEGGQYVNGRHQRPGGFEGDCTKYSEAALRGWRVLRVTGSMVMDGRALALIERALAMT